MTNKDANGGNAGVDPRTAALGPEAGALPLPVGTVLDRGFVIRSVLGRGGFGVTYMAEHTGLGRRVALKEHFPEQFAVREGLSVRATSSGAQMFRWGLDRFLDEARRLAGFKHPSIVDVTDVFEANGTAYMALAYEEGETLGKWLERLGRPPTQAELDRILAAILDALGHVHGHGILHRDIAPDNIILRRDGTPVLIDFGSARQALAERSHSLTGIVKHGYSPPEQYTRSSARHGPWSDIYALGATLYRAMTGVSPQEATDRVLGDKVQSLSKLASKGYRPGFLTGIMQALSLQPGDRPQSVAEWRELLLQGDRSPGGSRPSATAHASSAPTASVQRTGASASPRSISPSKQPQPPSGLLEPAPPSHTPWAMIGAVVVVIATLAGGGWFAYSTHRTEEARRFAEVRREIAAARTSEALDRVVGREPKLAPDVTKRREELAAIARSERLRLLRAEIDRETSTAGLDRIAAEAPELRPDVERRKGVLAAEAKAARLRVVRERIAASASPAELDRLAAEEPDARIDVEARKLALVRAARERRLQALRERVPAVIDDRELDQIVSEAPELAGAVQARRSELARVRDEQAAEASRRAERARHVRVQALRERIGVTTDTAELTRIANEAPELADVIEARKVELARLHADAEARRNAEAEQRRRTEDEARKRVEEEALARKRAEEDERSKVANLASQKATPPTAAPKNDDPVGLLGTWNCRSRMVIRAQGQTRNLNIAGKLVISDYDGNHYWASSSYTADGKRIRTKSKYWRKGGQLFFLIYQTSDQRAQRHLNRSIPVTLEKNRMSHSATYTQDGAVARSSSTCEKA